VLFSENLAVLPQFQGDHPLFEISISILKTRIFGYVKVIPKSIAHIPVPVPASRHRRIGLSFPAGQMNSLLLNVIANK
jgi:hypothetical protein